VKYADGRVILAGDVVRIDGLYRGTVVAAIDDGSYLPGDESWEYLGSGTMIDTNFAGLVHYQQNDDEQLELIHRAYK
jgi:hypothetical protein